MANKKVKKIKLSLDMEICSDLVNYIQECQQQEIDVENVCVKAFNAEDVNFSGTSFENVCFDHCDFSNVNLSRCSFYKVVFTACTFPDCVFTNSWFRQCLFENSQFKGCSFNESQFKDVTICDSNMSYANFTSDKFEACEIIKSDMSNSFFAQCTLKNFFVNDTLFIRTEFFQTALKGIDFSDCILEGISVSAGATELKGVIVNIYQAAELSKLMGIVIKDS
ncbi:pentapeptide repeat-containing protein [Proteocatella sphenisci]|uniref:pentapeptide repeat-containing protein n=1 Tax=Proteocatella sphenisci TaxID=181070 RepID=UPI00048B46C8|nr:pentapeptide repeat-containing protein [Proteocatella sphenisci]